MGGQLDGIFLAGSLPHEFIILIVTLFICLWLINFFLSLSDGFYRACPQSALGTAVEFRSLLRAAAVRRVLRGSNATDISDSAAVAVGGVAQW